MFANMFLKYGKAYLLVSLLFTLLTGCQKNEQPFDVWTEIAKDYTKDLSQTIKSLDELMICTEKECMIKAYDKARRYFKYAEPLLAYSEYNNYNSLNAPNILKVMEEDETDIKVVEPFGFQVMEEMIGEDSVDIVGLRSNIDKTKNRLSFIEKNYQPTRQKNYHLLWLLRQSLTRIATTGLTGFDSPVREASISESKIVYEKLQMYIQMAEPLFKDEKLYQAWLDEFESTKADLKGDFQTFDRYTFIKKHTHKQMELLNATTKDWEVTFPFAFALTNDFTSLFTKQTFNINNFRDTKEGEHSAPKVALGKMLFNDVLLSKDGKMSCATCHQSNLAFTDGLKVSKGQKRNSPTLLYAALQKGFFYDMRAPSLEGQIISVIDNETEFHTDLEKVTKVVANNPQYRAAFDTLYGGKISDATIRNAIAEYIRGLIPFNSKFDRNINNIESTLTASEIKGFNVFMGKGKCATCHFAPVFNGTVPPLYNDTEMELIGVPKEAVWKDATIDPDLGRYHYFKTENRKHFFKTPTVRNVEKTAPYMHNGVYQTLEEVVRFYNVGGGAGLGLDLEYQTLPPDSLHLSEDEIKGLVDFMRSLTDEGY